MLRSEIDAHDCVGMQKVPALNWSQRCGAEGSSYVEWCQEEEEEEEEPYGKLLFLAKGQRK
jgi:hypothetical protein